MVSPVPPHAHRSEAGNSEEAPQCPPLAGLLRFTLDALDGTRGSEGKALQPHQRLDVFLPKLREGLRRGGFDRGSIKAYERDIRTRANPKPLKTLKEYQDAWSACHVAMDILTDDDDGSEGADWLRALTNAVFDYEDAYQARHGYWPLHPGGPGWTTGPIGNA
jgi:hypothetical protein